MREIKFRAWDKEQNKMLLPDKWDWDWYLCNEYGVLSFPVMIARDYVMSYQTKKELILMQYTGLKDKNGVEIYEGDIIKHNGSILSVIYFDEEDAGFKLKNKSIGKMHPDKDYFQIYMEVIGNIYENPDLLD